MQDRYDHNEVEGRLRKFWELEGTYKFEPGSGKKVFAIDTPPPTVSGFIHVGHVFSYSQADFVARFRRMRGYMVFYPFGFDNNGIPTELLVEKNYNTTAEKVGREKFIDMVNQETNKYEQMYKEIWKNLSMTAK